MSSGRTFRLNSGHFIPAVGLGTWVARAVEYALAHGYRHIDAAAVHNNENEVDFLTSKLWNTHHKQEDVEEALDKSLSDLGTNYLDLYLIHWPVAFPKPAEEGVRFPSDPADGGTHVIDVPIEETWKALEALVRKGKVRSIGVSNFTKEKITQLLKFAEIPPAVNQIEAHPYLQQPNLLKWSKEQNILLTAYSPLGNNIYGLPMAIDDAEIIAIANELGKQPAQRGTAVVPKSVTPSRLASNFEDFELPGETMSRILSLDRKHRYNMPVRLGIDIFGEHHEAALKKARRDWIAVQKQVN
ncbi:aldehyde reductase [Thelonectria olida]|uniref:Aldehyde reductase n=1 Tax=Thelonectria olida TaxID=1576542 RepID=A0A9P9ANP0_9HYPO|nr:aldehyde reductase [Thelonectria olida]